MKKDNNMMLDFLVFLLTISACTGYTLTTSSDNATVGLDFAFTCVTTKTFIIFNRDSTTVCFITGGNTDGTCVLDPGYTPDYTYTCNTTTNTYTVTIPGSYLTDSLQGTTWRCEDPFGGGGSNIKILYVNVPVPSVTLLSTPTDKNPVEIVSNRNQTFSCTTNAARPSSRIQWYLSTTNITTSASPQPDVCNTDCSDDKIISSSVLTYTGNINDDGKILYCTAVNIEGWSVVRSSDKTIVIWYAPSKIPSIQQKPQGPIMVDTNVTLICTVANGNPLAMLSWNCTGTTVSSTVGNTTSQSVLLTVNKTNIMCICSAIHPVSSYRPRVEHIMHAYSIDSKADIECNASATVIIRCSLTPQGTPVNPVKWLHHFKNRTIRSLRGDISGSDFTLTLPFCNYQDIGSYSCVWNTSYELVHKLVIVSVSGPPIISDQTVVVKGNEVLVSSLFYAVPHPENPIWYAAGNVLPIGKKYRLSTFPTKIMLRLYNEIVDLDGYISTLFIDDFHSIDQGTYTCTIRNPFGSLNVDIDTRETTQSKTEECSSTELSVGVFVGSLVACIIATAAVSTCLQMIICQQIKKSKRLAKDRSNQYQDIAMSTTTNVYDTVNE